MKFSIFSVADHYPGLSRPVGQLYDEVIAQCAQADALGFEAYFVAEHHFHEYGAIPNPAVALAAMARASQRIRLGPAVSVLPFRDPRQVAEDYALLDQLSKGRLIMGVGSGYLKHEYDGFGIDGADKRLRFDEGLEIVRRLWSGERVSFAGDHYRLDEVALNVLPWGGRMPEIYIASLRPEVAYWIGKAGNHIMTVPYASLDRFEEIGGLIGEYQRGLAEGGGETGGALVALHTHVAESDEAVREQAAAAFDLYVETRLYAKSQTYDDVMASGLALFGSVETVVQKVVALHRMGVRHIMLLNNFGALDAGLVSASMTLFAREVIPRARTLIEPADG